MTDEQKARIKESQDEARREVAAFFDDMTGENGPVDVVIAFRCPDGQVGYVRTDKSMPHDLVGLIEIAKHSILASAMSPMPRASGVN